MRAGESNALETFDFATGTKQLREGTLVAELNTIGVYVLTKKGDFNDTLGNQGLDFGKNLPRTTILLFAA